MTVLKMEPQYLYKLLSMPRGATSTTLIGNKCNIPYYTIVIDQLGNCLLCDCDGWLPIPVGKVEDFNSIDEVLSSPIAKMLQQDVSAGKFMWCAVDHCGIRNQDRIKKHVTLSINIDDSCNLQCPSCRRDSIMLTSGPVYDYRLQMANIILGWLEKYDYPIRINTSGSGDPLASAIMRPIIKNFYPKDDQTFMISTNGLLIKKQISDGLPIFDSITTFKISIDAGSKEVYEDVRRPGKWEVLLENFDYLKMLGKGSSVQLMFALQNKNYKDIPRFVDLCNHYGFYGVIHQLDDWGTWAQMKSKIPDAWTIQNGIFADHNVLNSSHPTHNKCKELVVQYQNFKNISFAPMVLRLLGV